MEKIYRNHPISIFENFLKSSWKFIIPMFFIAFKDIAEGSLWVLALLIPILLVTFIYSVLSWRKTVYSFSDKHIAVQSGVFKVLKKQILFERIQTFDVLEPMFYRPFGIVVLKIDTGNTTEEGSDIALKTKKEQVEVLRKLVFAFKSEDKAEADSSETYAEKIPIVTHIVKPKEIFALGATNNSLWMGIVALGTIYKVFDDYLARWIDIDWNFLSNQVSSYSAEKIGGFKLLGLIVIILFIYAVISTIFGVISSYIKYEGFTVIRTADEIKINYGLLNKKHYQFPLKKINAVYFRQNLVQSLFGYQKICIEIIGYGNESGEEALLYPLIKRKNAKQILKDILPEMLFESEVEYVHSKTAIKFIISKLIWRAIVVFILVVFVKRIPFLYSSIFGVILILDGVLVGHCEYKHTAIGISENLIFLSYKGRGREEVILPIRKIESFELLQTPFQRRANLMNYRIHVWSNGLRGNYMVKHLDKGIYKDKLLKL